MPLVKGKSKKVISQNIRDLRRSQLSNMPINESVGGSWSYPHRPTLSAADEEELRLITATGIAGVMFEQNVSIRRDLLAEMGGVESFLKRTPHRVIDKTDGYRLLLVGSRNKQDKDHPFRGWSGDFFTYLLLEMRNPSTKELHIEGVPAECRTVQDALNWRAWGTINKPWKPKILT